MLLLKKCIKAYLLNLSSRYIRKLKVNPQKIQQHLIKKVSIKKDKVIFLKNQINNHLKEMIMLMGLTMIIKNSISINQNKKLKLKSKIMINKKIK